MKLKDVILIVVLVVALLLALAYFFKPKSGETEPGNNTQGNDDPDNPGAIPCQKIPGNLPPFQNAITPPGAKAFLGVPDAEWTPDFEARLRGFFLAVDVEPTEYAMKYFGSKLIWQYLNSQDGQLPDMVVLKGSKRCDTIVGVPANDIPKPPFCLNFTAGNWLEPTYKDGKDAGSDAIRAVFGIPKDQWTPAMQSRVKGFFKAIDIEPSEGNAKGVYKWWDGRYPIHEYLNSPLGGLPDTLITKGIMRCDGKGNNDQFINNL